MIFMRKTWQDIIYSPLWLLLLFVAWLPLSISYMLGDVLYIIIYRVVKYRKKVVRHNLSLAFPEKTDIERQEIEQKFYRHFANYIIETIKLMHISDEEMRKRMQFENTEIIDELTSQGRSVILLLGHYGNWEWIPSITIWLKNSRIQPAQIYRPLKNEWFDRLFLKIRSRFGSEGIAKNDTLRRLLQYKRDGIPSVIGFISDQTPSQNNIHHWVEFFGMETAVITGYETIAHKLDMDFVYLDVELVSRGYYKATCRLMEKGVDYDVQQYTIANRYMKAFEQTIRRKPYAWLWTHKRWKYTPTANTKR